MKILTVCLGNICRSPLAEGLLKKYLPEDFIVDSAGTISLHEGENPDKRAVETAGNYQVDISKQRSRPITAADLEKFDKIYCMDISVMEDVISMAKNEEQRQKIFLFLQEAEIPENNYEVFDPYWSGLDGFEKVFLLLDEASQKVAAKLTAEKSNK